MKNIKKVASFEVKTQVDFNPDKDFFDRIIEKANFYKVYEKHAEVSNKLKQNQTYLLEIWEALEDLSMSEVDEILKTQNAIKSGSQALLLAFDQKKELFPVGMHIVSPEVIEILPKNEHGYSCHLGVIRLSGGEIYGFDHGDASAIYKGDCIMITMEI